jgi:hypothetical protein
MTSLHRTSSCAPDTTPPADASVTAFVAAASTETAGR